MPQSARERARGSMATLLPMYRLLLEVIAVRWPRRETAALLAAVHISSEYLPLRPGLARRCRLARAYADSPLVRLRHAAPGGPARAG
jgi:hypothetical protein